MENRIINKLNLISVGSRMCLVSFFFYVDTHTLVSNSRNCGNVETLICCLFHNNLQLWQSWWTSILCRS